MLHIELTSKDILEPLSWPLRPWSGSFEFISTDAKAIVDGQEMGPAEATLVSYLDVQKIEHLRVDIGLDLKAKRTGLSARIALVGSVLRRCVLSGEILSEKVDTKDCFNFIKQPQGENPHQNPCPQMVEDFGTGLEEGPDAWDDGHAPTLVGLIADCLEEVLEPTPRIEGAEVARFYAKDPKERELSEKTHPFAALKALKKHHYDG